MAEEAVFVREGEQLVPGPHAIGPWAADRLHGGPVIGLIARAALIVESDPELVLARLTVDMFRAVPATPLSVRVESLRKGSRLALLRVGVISDGDEYAQGTALLLRPNAALPAGSDEPAPRPVGPDALPTESLMRGAARVSGAPKGFHTRVETRWVPRAPGEPLAIWFRQPMPLVAGEPLSPTIAALALADFANALAAITAAERGRGAPYINADTTLYLSRRPQGEWFCLRENGFQTVQGISTAEALLFDQEGPIGRALQARVAVR